MGKTIRFNENGLIAIKKRLNEIMAGNDEVVSPNDVITIENKHPKELDDNISNEFAPVTEIGADPKSPMGGTYYHQKQTNESIDFNKNGLSINDDKILDKYNLKDLILSKNGNYVTLNKIVANEFGKGNGSRFMEELTKIADDNGWILALTPDISFGGSSVVRLKNFYKRFGFKPNKGRNTDFNTRESMVRKPEKSKNVIIPENKLGIIKENIEREIESSEVDLSSFKKRDTLPPGIWKDEETLDSRVRLKLLDIADDFWEFINLSWVEPKGIIITGSICNFNWSKFSDIDLHIIADFREIDEKTEFVKQYVDSKKNEWNNEHEGLKIMGFPVELYVQDVDDDIEAGGIYDLEENAWVRRPNPHSIKSIGLNKFSIKDKAAEIMTIIDDMYGKLSTTTDGHEVDQIGDDAHYLWDKVKDLRKKSLSKNGESGSGNIVYKVLRRTGYLDKLFKLFSTVYDRSNSITEGKYSGININAEKPSEEEYFFAKNHIDDAHSNKEYDYYKDIIDRYELDDNLCDDLTRLSTEHLLAKKTRGSEYIMTNGKIIGVCGHASVDEIGVNKVDLLKRGFIRIIGGLYSNYVYVELAKYPNDVQERKLLYYLSTCDDYVHVDITYDNELKKSFSFDRKTFSPELIMKNIKDYFGITTESVRSYLATLNEEVALDGSTEDNPYEKRWKAEREALKSFVANYGKLMQSKEDNKGGKLYKVYFDETMSNLIGYNYCICVQWNEQEMKPGSTVYIRALDKFTPFIRRDLQFDTRGRDNMRGTYDDTGY